MGDRYVIGMRSNGHETMYLYSHWGGDEQEKDLANALLAARGRWDDPFYANRILVSQIVGTQWHGELGYGLSVGEYPDPDYDYLYEVDWDARKVYRVHLYEHGGKTGTEDEYTLEQFVSEQLIGV
jgi:hypothetical protein